VEAEMREDVREKVERQTRHINSKSENDPSVNLVTTSDALEIQYTAPKHVSDVVAALALGRAEDVKFSPNKRRLAVASYSRNKIAVFEVCIAASHEFSSDYLRQPHGVQFIDDETIIVANRRRNNI
jgi:hypothetical protein